MTTAFFTLGLVTAAAWALVLYDYLARRQQRRARTDRRSAGFAGARGPSSSVRGASYPAHSA